MTTHSKIKIVLFSFSYFVILFFAANSYSQTVYPNCTGGTLSGTSGTGCYSSGELASMAASCQYSFSATPVASPRQFCVNLGNQDVNFSCRQNASCSCPSGLSLIGGVCQPDPEQCLSPNVEYDGVCQLPVDSPQDCESEVIDVTAVQMPGGGYVCMPGGDYPCEEGMTPGTVAGSNSIISVCDQPTGGSSSSTSSESSTSSSAGSSEGGGGSSGGSGGDGSSSTGSSESSSSSSESSSSGGGGSSGQSSSSGGSSSAGSGNSSSVGEGTCDPTATDYALCIQFTEEISDTAASDIISEFEDGAGTELDDAYDQLTDDVEGFSSVDSEFENAPSELRQALNQFIPSQASCSPIQLEFMGNAGDIPCHYFDTFKLIFGWFLTIMAAIHIWSFCTAPVQR